MKKRKWYIDGNAKEFISRPSYEDHYAVYNGKKYFFNGCRTAKGDEGEIINVTLEVYDLDAGKTVFSTSRPSAEECISEFENAKIWDGKSFWDVEQEMQWVDD